MIRRNAMVTSLLSSLRWMVISSLLVLSLMQSAQADANEDAIRGVIEGQLNAFAVDKGDEAYSYAAPIVKMAFPNPVIFMMMVKKGYQPVYRNSRRDFGKVFNDRLGRPAMRVVLTAADGKRYEAVYGMEQQADGSWKIASCMILEIPAQEV
jgi:hypothetical protein